MQQSSTGTQSIRPLTVITGIVLGTCVSIAVSLAAVTFIFLVLGGKYPRLGYEFPTLLTSLGLFLIMTAVSAVSFYWTITGHPRRLVAQVAMWLGIAATAYYYWP